MDDLFGQPVIDGPKLTRSGRKKRDETPRGYARPPGTGPKGETCRTCVNVVSAGSGNKTYYKCLLIKFRWTSSYGTDIRLKSPACELWKPETKNETNPV